ncbi:hypothetical protein NL676_029164 [Syzygium grande]|nr:hypothetical protein NL676_029164 [Syzygium grande]
MLSSFVFVMKEVKKKLLPKKMPTASNGTLNHQNHYHCTISLEGLAVRTTVTIRCHHTFHLGRLPGSAFNAANPMQCPVCRAVEEGVWRSFLTRAPRSSRAGPHVAQEDVQEPPVRMVINGHPHLPRVVLRLQLSVSWDPVNSYPT